MRQRQRLHRGTRTLRQGQGLLGVTVGRNQHELFTAVARHQIAGAAHRRNGLCHFAQTPVTGRVAVVVVVGLEPIHIQHHQRQGLLLARHALPFFLQHLVKLAAVGNVGQAVHQAQGFELVVERLQLLGALLDPQRQRAF